MDGDERVDRIRYLANVVMDKHAGMFGFVSQRYEPICAYVYGIGFTPEGRALLDGFQEFVSVTRSGSRALLWSAGVLAGMDRDAAIRALGTGSHPATPEENAQATVLLREALLDFADAIESGEIDAICARCDETLPNN